MDNSVAEIKHTHSDFPVVLPKTRHCNFHFCPFNICNCSFCFVFMSCTFGSEADLVSGCCGVKAVEPLGEVGWLSSDLQQGFKLERLIRSARRRPS